MFVFGSSTFRYRTPLHVAMAQLSKRRRLSKLCGLGGVSDAGLSKILKEPGPKLESYLYHHP